MVTRRLLGSMETWLANTFLPLLLLTWLPVGLGPQIAATVDVLVGLDVILQCLPQAGSSSTAREVKWFNVTRNDGKLQNGGGVEMKNDLAHLVFANVNKAHAGTYTCRVENTKNTFKNRYSELSKVGTVGQLVQPVTTVQFEICLENLTVQVKWYKPKCLEGEIQTNTAVLGENCVNFSSSSLCTAHTGICVCRVFFTRPNSTDTGNSMQAAVLSCGSAGPQTDVTGKTWTGLNLLLCILLGLAVGTLLYMPVIGFLLWQCRKNRTGELVSGEVAERNQAALVTGTEDLTYANLNFEKKGTGPAPSNVIYTEIKPSQQKQSGEDGSAASTEVGVSPKEEGK